MDEKLLAIVTQLAQLTASVNKLIERVDKHVADLDEFAQRFEEVVEQMENERRLDLMNDYN